MALFTKRELISISLASIIIAFSANLFLHGALSFLWALVAIFVVIMINILAKKTAGFYLETDTETKFWETYWFKSKSFPLGALLPLISKIILFPISGFVWMASLVFEVRPKSYHSAGRHGLYIFSGMTESHIGYIAAAGIAANLFFAVIGYLLGFTDFARFSIYYTLFNMIPISNLDGNKIFSGNIVIWSFLASLVLIGLFFAVFIV